MADRSSWVSIRDRRMAEPAARPAYDAARLAYELGRTVRQLREIRGWSQTELANAASMTKLALARFEAGGAVPNLPTLERLASTLDADLAVEIVPRADAGGEFA